MSILTMAHFSEKEIKFEHKIYNQKDLKVLTPYTKPEGFWLSGKNEYYDSTDENSFEWDWKEFCITAGFRGETLKHFQLFEVDTKELLVINNEEDYDTFFKDVYEIQTPLGKCINPKIFKDFKGLCIPNYIGSMRMEIDWYYTWDVASAVIWDTNGVLRLL